MMTRSPDSIAEPQPCAILGTLSSSVASKFATVTGVYDLLQVVPGLLLITSTINHFIRSFLEPIHLMEQQQKIFQSLWMKL